MLGYENINKHYNFKSWRFVFIKERFLLILILFSSPKVYSNEFDYNFFQIGFSRFIDSVNTISAGGSIDISKEFSFLIGGEIGNFENDTKSKLGEVGLGYHTNISDDFDFLLSATIIAAEVDAPKWSSSGSKSDQGYSISLGTRSWSSDKVELNAYVVYANIFDDSEVTLGIGFRYYLKNSTSIGLHLGWAHRNEDLGAGISLRF